VQDLGLELLCVSQFTLGHSLKGNKPDFSGAMGGDAACELYQELLSELRRLYDPTKVKDGKFGAMMVVDIANDGPVTLEVEYLAQSSS
jgi:D-tyrosyl-tRNA(Tyr) deacylase